MEERITIRLSAAYRAWLDQVAGGGEAVAAARALIVLGAAALQLDGAAREAQRLLAADLSGDVLAALQAVVGGSEPIPTQNMALAARRQPDGSQTAAKRQPSGSQAAAKRQPSGSQDAQEPMIEPDDADPFAGVGLSV